MLSLLMNRYKMLTINMSIYPHFKLAVRKPKRHKKNLRSLTAEVFN